MMPLVPRRANHEGTLPRKVSGRDLYRVRVMLDGRPHDVYRRTERETVAAARALVNDWERGLAPLDTRYTVGEWLDDWLRVHVEPVVAYRTWESYRDTVRLYLRPALGAIALAKLRPEQITRMLAELRGPRGELSPTTRRYVYAVLRIALGRAVKVGRLHRNVATLVDPPAPAPFHVEPLTTDEAERLQAALAGKRHEALILTALSCGLREGELLGLTWPAVDLERGRLDVRHQLERGTRLLVPPKRESRRRIDLPARTVAALRAHQAAQKRERIGVHDWDPREFVFATADGQPLTSGTAVRAFRAVLASAGLPKRRLHDLRHTFATWMIEGGADLSVVSKLLGHKDITTTANVYGHLTDEMRRDAAERMEQMLRRRA